MCSVYIIRLSLVKSLSWKWINTGPVPGLIKIFITKMRNKNFSALRINKILIARFDLLAGLSLDWLTSIHLPESSSICVHFWEILLFFFFFLSLLNHFWGPFDISFLTNTAKWKTPADSSLKTQKLNAFT